MEQEIVAPWKQEDLVNVPKKELIEFLKKNGSNEFLHRHALQGKIQNVIKAVNKNKADAAYTDLFATKQFRTEKDDEELAAAEERRQTKAITAQKTASSSSSNSSGSQAASAASAAPEKKGYQKVVLKKGDKTNFPKKGDTVSVRYTGKLENGQVFDTNTGRKAPALKFKVGTGKVIRGWDEALLEMSKGEKAKITIEPDWAYGAKGIPGTIPPNSKLIFEVELESIS